MANFDEISAAVAVQQALETALADARADVEAAHVLVNADIATEYATFSAARAIFETAQDAARAIRGWGALDAVREQAEQASHAGRQVLLSALAGYDPYNYD
jgi:hypothetical protein